MDYIYLGEIVNTHGLVGEIRIISDLKEKDKVFQIGNYIYIGKDKEKAEITSYRKHKNYDMITCKNKTSIDQVLPWKGKNVYVKRGEITFDSFVKEDFLGMTVFYQGKNIGTIKDMVTNGMYELFVIEGKKEYLIPNLPHFIETISIEKKQIHLKGLEGFWNEN